MQSSLWSQKESLTFPVFKGRHKCDAVVIGGGLCGITTALWLTRAGLRVTLLEAGSIGNGASRCCLGTVTVSDRAIFQTIRSFYGDDFVQAYAQTQLAAVKAVRKTARELSRSIGWRDADVRVTGEQKGMNQLYKEKEAMNFSGVDASMTTEICHLFGASGAVEIEGGGVLNPVRYMEAMLKKAIGLGLNVYEHSPVLGLEANMAFTQGGSVTAPYMVMATGYPIINVPGWYFLKLVQNQSWVIPLESCPDFEQVIADGRGRYMLRRTDQGVFLQLNGYTAGTKRNRHVMRDFENRFVDHRVVFDLNRTVSGLQILTRDGLPFIGTYSSKTPNMFVATGFGSRGIVGSMLAAQTICADVLCLDQTDYEIYRTKGRKKALKIPFLSGMRYLGSLAAHLHAPICTHMGCRLIYDEKNKLWVCPCHGSCYDDIGHVLNAPAVRDTPIHHRKKQ